MTETEVLLPLLAFFVGLSVMLRLPNRMPYDYASYLSLATLAGMGYRLVLYPLTAFRVALHAAQRALEELHQKGHQRDLLPQMLTRAELYDLLGYAGYEERDRAYFG